MGTTANVVSRVPWNKGKIVGQKAPFKLKDIWALILMSVQVEPKNPRPSRDTPQRGAVRL